MVAGGGSSGFYSVCPFVHLYIQSEPHVDYAQYAVRTIEEHYRDTVPNMGYISLKP